MVRILEHLIPDRVLGLGLRYRPDSHKRDDFETQSIAFFDVRDDLDHAFGLTIFKSLALRSRFDPLLKLTKSTLQKLVSQREIDCGDHPILGPENTHVHSRHIFNKPHQIFIATLYDQIQNANGILIPLIIIDYEHLNLQFHKPKDAS